MDRHKYMFIFIQNEISFKKKDKPNISNRNLILKTK